MSDWNPSLYLHFAAERSRPAVELLARVPLENIEYIADLGCGPGNSTALLYQRWPAARITGVDSSPAMIAETRSALPDCLFVEADIRNWQPEQALDLIFANASLQWLPDHYELFPHLVSLLPFPAWSKAVPWSTDARMIGRPSVILTPATASHFCSA